MYHSRQRLTLLALLLTLALAGPVASQKPSDIDPVALYDKDKVWYNGFTETWFTFFDIPEDEVRRSIVQWEEIGRDLDKSELSTSGTYASGGETHGSYVRWSEKMGFVWLDIDKCQGGPMRVLRGRVQPSIEGVLLIPETILGGSGGHNGHAGHASAATGINLVSITWRDSVFLVRKERVSDFSDFAAGLGEFNGQFTYVFDNPFLVKMSGTKREDVQEQLLPTYPTGYEGYKRYPVRGSIIHIGKGLRRANPDSDSFDEFVTPISIRVQHPENLAPGIFLHAVGVDEGFMESFTVEWFKNNIAKVNHVRSIPKRNCVVSAYSDCKAVDHTKLRVGLTLSSNGL